MCANLINRILALKVTQLIKGVLRVTTMERLRINKLHNTSTGWHLSRSQSTVSQVVFLLIFVCKRTVFFIPKYKYTECMDDEVYIFTNTKISCFSKLRA